MKAIMISIKPEWVSKILNGEKTIEIRKTKPKCELPIDVYIYCTKGKRLYYQFGWYDENRIRVNDYWHTIESLGGCYGFNGKVVAKFTLNKVEEIKVNKDFSAMDEHSKDLIRTAQLSLFQGCDYLNFKNGYAWHIDNLVIFDSSKELNEFYPYCKDEKCEYRNNHCSICYRTPLTKAPESWCYVEVLGD